VIAELLRWLLLLLLSSKVNSTALAPITNRAKTIYKPSISSANSDSMCSKPNIRASPVSAVPAAFKPPTGWKKKLI